MSSSTEIGAAIRAQRVARRMTLEEVAFAAGVNRRVVSELERGKPTVQLDIVLRTLAVVGLDLTLQERA